MTTNIADLKQSDRVTLVRGNDYVTFFRTAYKFISMEHSVGADKGLQDYLRDEAAQEWLNQFLADGFEESARFIGYHDKLPINRGDTVTILKGTLVKTIGQAPKPAGRTYKVKVHHTICGSNAHHWGPGNELTLSTNPTVCWAGAGGYWSSVDINDVPEAQPTAEFKIKVGETTYLVDVSTLGQVNVFHTMLDGLASSSLAGEATIKGGKITKCSPSLTEEAWAAIQNAIVAG